MSNNGEELSLLLELISRGFFTTVFQPIVDTASGGTVGYESLLRGPEDSLLARPGRIFSDEACVPDQIRRVVDRMAIDSTVRTARNLPNDDLLFINVLDETLSGIVAALPDFLGLLEELEIMPDRIVFELSETTGRDGLERLEGCLRAVRRAGMRLALDDIGVRSPYLYHLLMLEPEFLKLDWIFVKGIDASRRKQDLVQCMEATARRMGALLIAEGIETAQEFETMKRIGIPLAQGYLIGRPSAAEHWQRVQHAEEVRHDEQGSPNIL